MSVAMPSVSTSAQALIDARLEAIERFLLDRVPRQDRLTIVREVESQIHELLAERGVDEASREDVLAVLARLDPPEAYMIEDEPRQVETSTRRSLPRPVQAPSAARTHAARNGFDRLAKIGGIISLSGFGLLACFSLMLMLVLATNMNIGNYGGGLLEIGMFGAMILSVLTSLTGIMCAGISRFQNWWAISGSIASGLSLIAVMIFVVMFF